jgi:hypothetical protein
VTQTGSTLAAASAGGTLRYFRVPPAVTAAESAAPEEALQTLLPGVTEPSSVPVSGIRPTSKTRRVAPLSPRPVLTPLQPILSREQAAAVAAAPLAVIVSNDSASKAGLAGRASKRAKDAEQAPGRSPRGLCLASCSGASAASAGTGSGGAFLASSGHALSPVQLLGRRQSAPAGRRPAAVVLLRAKPG